MKLSFLVSVPHAELYILPEALDICRLTPEEIYTGRAATIFHGRLEAADAQCSADIARAIADLN